MNANHTNSILRRKELAVELFTTNPEVLDPQYWEFLLVQASVPAHAEATISEVEKLMSCGVTVSRTITGYAIDVLDTANATMSKNRIPTKSNVIEISVLKHAG